MKRTTLILSSLIVILSFFVLPASSAVAQSKHASHAAIPLSTTSWCYYDTGRPGSSYSCDGHDQAADLGGNLACGTSGHFVEDQHGTIYNSHGDLVGTFHLYNSLASWCKSVWGALNVTGAYAASNLTGSAGIYDNKDEAGIYAPTAQPGSWDSIVMDEYSGYGIDACKSVWIYGNSNGYPFSQKLIDGGAGC
jgi:hypothetical protein